MEECTSLCCVREPLKEKVVIIISGGMDSTTLLYDIVHQGFDVHAISFNYGQRHKKELKVAKKSCLKLKVPHTILNLRVLNKVAPSCLTRDTDVPEGHYESENMKQTVVPNRNMVMLSLATSFAIGIGAKKIFYGAHAGDHAIYPDCRKEFIDKMKEVMLVCDWSPVELIAPYWDIDKGDIVLKGQNLNVDYKKTWTCYNGRRKACGKCGACQERLEAFKKAGLRDPVRYEVNNG